VQVYDFQKRAKDQGGGYLHKACIDKPKVSAIYDTIPFGGIAVKPAHKQAAGGGRKCTEHSFKETACGTQIFCTKCGVAKMMQNVV
jgi:hypothetical protein